MSFLQKFATNMHSKPTRVDGFTTSAGPSHENLVAKRFVRFRDYFLQLLLKL